MAIPVFGTRLPSSGIFSCQDIRRERRERKGEEERGGDALLRHSITNPFQKCTQAGSPSRPIQTDEKAPTHRPRCVLGLSSNCPSVFAAAQTNKSRGLESEWLFPFPLGHPSYHLFWPTLGHSPPVQSRKLLTPVTLSVETLGTCLLAKAKKKNLFYKWLKLQPCSNRSYRLETGVMSQILKPNWVVPFILF